jgi:thioredoxin-like negative regulator of GroEL
VLHTNKEIQTILKGFVLTKIDAAHADSQSLGTKYIPLMVFFSPDGKELERKVGFTSENELRELLRKVLAK